MGEAHGKQLQELQKDPLHAGGGICSLALKSPHTMCNLLQEAISGHKVIVGRHLAISQEEALKEWVWPLLDQAVTCGGMCTLRGFNTPTQQQ